MSCYTGIYTSVISGAKFGDSWNGMNVTVSGDGAPLNLSGATIRMQTRKAPDYPSYAYQWHTDYSGTASGINITSAASGQFYVCSGIVTMAPNTYYWDIEITLASTQKATPLAGTWEIYWDVTR